MYPKWSANLMYLLLYVRLVQPITGFRYGIRGQEVTKIVQDQYNQ